MADSSINGDAVNFACAMQAAGLERTEQREKDIRVLKEWLVEYTDGDKTTVRGHDIWPDEGRIWVAWTDVGIVWSGLSTAVESVFLFDPVLADLEKR